MGCAELCGVTWRNCWLSHWASGRAGFGSGMMLTRQKPSPCAEFLWKPTLGSFDTELTQVVKSRGRQKRKNKLLDVRRETGMEKSHLYLLGKITCFGIKFLWTSFRVIHDKQLKWLSDSPRSSILSLSSEKKSRGWKKPGWFVSQAAGTIAGALQNTCSTCVCCFPSSPRQTQRKEWWRPVLTGTSISQQPAFLSHLQEKTFEDLFPWNIGLMSCWISSVVCARRLTKDTQQGQRRWQERLHFLPVGELIFPIFSNCR